MPAIRPVAPQSALDGALDLLVGRLEVGRPVALSFGHELLVVRGPTARTDAPFYSGRSELDASALTAVVRRRLSVSTRDLPAAIEVLRRAGYGPRPGDSGVVLDEGRAVDAPDAVAALLAAAGHPPTRLVVEPDDLKRSSCARSATAMRDALAAESVKLRRPRLPWITAIGFTLATVVSGLFTYIAQDPDRARSLGLAGAKAQMAGITADWTLRATLLPMSVRPVTLTWGIR